MVFISGVLKSWRIKSQVEVGDEDIWKLVRTGGGSRVVLSLATVEGVVCGCVQASMLKLVS